MVRLSLITANDTIKIICSDQTTTNGRKFPECMISHRRELQTRTGLVTGVSASVTYV